MKIKHQQSFTTCPSLLDCIMTLCIVLFITVIRTVTATSYDYIIVGAGTAGSVLASELSKDSKTTVLLIEEGGWSSEWGDVIDNAKNYWSVLNIKQIERGYLSTTQININNRTLPLFRAKTTGGCGSHYGMCWTLGNKKDFDERWDIDNFRWTDLSKHWDYIQNTFETNTIKYDKFTAKFLQAAEQHGYKFNPNYNDLNKNGQIGASLFQYAAKLKEKQNKYDHDPTVYASRQNSWTQYIEPIISQRYNLDVMVYHRVNKILFNLDTTNPTAIGVETTNVATNRQNKFYASREVILSAGSFDSPKILLLSGIGDCNKYNLSKCIANIPAVGQSLQDHFYFMVESPPLKKNHFMVQNLTLPPFIFGSDFRVILYDKNHDFEFMFVVDSKQKINDTNAIDFNSMQTAETIQIFVLPLHLKSRGHIELIDDNAASPPLIDINFLSTKYDEHLLIKSVKKARELLYSNSLIDLYENIDEEISPGSNIQTDKEILEWTKTVLLTDYHPVGTCKMGMHPHHESIVVNNRLCVRGVNNLRIVDASIMPEVVSGHTYAATTLIAFKAAELILQDNANHIDQKHEL